MDAEGSLLGVIQLCNKKSNFDHYDEFLVICIVSLLRIIIPHLNQKEMLKRKVDECNQLLHISKIVTAQLQIDNVVESILRAVKQLVRAERASFFHVDNENDELFTTIDSKEFRIPISKGVVGHAVSSGTSINVKDTSKSPFWDATIDKQTGYHTINMLAVPILSLNENKVVGVIQMINKIDEDCFTDEDLSILESFTHFASISLNNSFVYGNSIIKEQKVSQLFDTYKKISTSLNLNDLLTSITQEARKLLNADRGSVFLIDYDTNSLVSTVTDGIDSIRIPLGKGIGGYVASTGQCVNIPDVYNDDRFYDVVDKVSGYKTKSILCVPIFNSNDQVIGVTQMINKGNHLNESFTNEDEKLLSAFAKDASVFIQNSKLYEQAKKNEKRASLEVQATKKQFLDLEYKILIKITCEKVKFSCNSQSCIIYLLNAEGNKFEAIEDKEVSGESLQIEFVKSFTLSSNKKSRYLLRQTNENSQIKYQLFCALEFENNTIGIVKLQRNKEFLECKIDEILESIEIEIVDVLNNVFKQENKEDPNEENSNNNNNEELSVISLSVIKNSQLFKQTAKMHCYLQAVLSTIDHLVFTIDDKGQFVRSNHSLEKFGFPSDIITTLPCTEWASHFHPLNERFFTHINQCKNENKTIHHQLFELFNNNSPSRFIRYTIVPLSTEKIVQREYKSPGTVIIIEDITTNKKLNQSLEIFQSSALSLISPSFNPTFQLQSLLRMMLRILDGSEIIFFSGENENNLKLLYHLTQSSSSSSSTNDNNESCIFYHSDVIKQAMEKKNLIFIPHQNKKTEQTDFSPVSTPIHSRCNTNDNNDDQNSEFQFHSESSKKDNYNGILCSPLLVADHIRGIVYLKGISHTKLPSIDKRIFLVFTSVLVCYFEIKNKITGELEKIQQEFESSNEKIIQLKDKVIESEKTKETFLMNMSHELRTPLNSIIGTSELLTTTKLNNQQLQFLKSIEKSAKSLLNIINNILNYTRIDSNQISLQSKVFDLRATLEDEISLVSEKYKSKNIEIVLLLNPNENTFIIGDPHRIRQIFTNLIGNACKFSNSNSNVIISVSKIDNNKDQDDNVIFHFSIIDQGIGMSLEEQKNLFKPFFQCDSSTTRKFEGIGLGLVLARHLINLMKGEIQIQSSPNQGTKISFCCTFKKQKLNTTENKKKKLSLSSLGINKQNNILLISNSKSKILLEKIFIELLNFQCTSFDSKSNFFDFFESKKSENLNLSDFFSSFSYCIIDLDIYLHIDIVRFFSSFSNSLAFIPIVFKFNNSNDNMSIISTHKQVIFIPVILTQVIRCFSQNFSPPKTNPHPQILNSLSTPSLVRSTIQSPIIKDKRCTLTQSSRLPKPENENYSTNTTDTNDVDDDEIIFKKILLVEDNKMNQKVATRQLQKLGIECDIAENGKVGVEMFQKFPYRLVLMDCHMPIMDGYEATKKIREYEDNSEVHHVPIVALTADSLAGTKDLCLAAGMDAYFAKPLKQKDFIEIQQKYLL